MHFTTSIVAMGLASYASAHMVMSNPKPFGKSTLNNSPLFGDGSDFPCKQRPGVYNAEGVSNPMALGSTQPLNFVGSAVHGGGSCQVSITYDAQPDKNSVWKVIHSIEGGCPMIGAAGNNGDSASQPAPDTYHFTIPTGLPTGNAVLAWTWFNKIGNREMYMNCAPVTLSGGNTKRTDAEDQLVGNLTQLVERDQSFYNSLPDMFTANIGKGCGTQDSKDVAFPNPGDSVERLGLATLQPVPPTGSCQTAVGGGSSPVATTAPVVSSSAVSTAAPSVTSAPSLPGGVFITVPSASQTPATTASPSPVASSTPGVAPVPVASSTPVVVAPSPVETSAAPAVPAESTAAPLPVVGGTTITPGTACPGDEGNWNCIGGNSFQRCASGRWSVVQSVAAGTQCETGISQYIKIGFATPAKREIRFSGAHVRRHLMRSS